MRSYLNRNKNFFLDNSIPEAKNNILRMNSKNFSKGEFYLWSWSEILLRYKRMSECRKVKKAIVIKNDDLMHPNKISKILDTLNSISNFIEGNNKLQSRRVNYSNNYLEIKSKQINDYFLSTIYKDIPTRNIKIFNYIEMDSDKNTIMRLENNKFLLNRFILNNISNNNHRER